MAAYCCGAQLLLAFPSCGAGAGSIPVTRTGDGCYEIRLNADAGESLSWNALLEPEPFANERTPLTVRCVPDPRGGSRGFTGAEIHASIRPQSAGSSVEIAIAGAGSTGLARSCDAMLRAAERERAGARALRSGLKPLPERAGADLPFRDPLRPSLRARAMLQQASWLEGEGDPRGSLAVLAHARRIDPGVPILEERAARLARSLGYDGLAADGTALARLLGAAGASLRGFAQGRLRSADPATGASLTARAESAIEARDLESAASLLARIRTISPERRRDLRLAHELQSALGLHRDALATAMLLREYDPSPSSEALLHESLQKVRAYSLAARSRARLVELASPAR
ncbi:MAG: hypothetical protein Fur0037_18820 [Planctomycetota bacterium]